MIYMIKRIVQSPIADFQEEKWQKQGGRNKMAETRWWPL